VRTPVRSRTVGLRELTRYSAEERGCAFIHVVPGEVQFDYVEIPVWDCIGDRRLAMPVFEVDVQIVPVQEQFDYGDIPVCGCVRDCCFAISVFAVDVQILPGEEPLDYFFALVFNYPGERRLAVSVLWVDIHNVLSKEFFITECWLFTIALNSSDRPFLSLKW
jgi:hypothetical protein